MMGRGRIIWLSFWFALTMAGSVHAELSAPLDREISGLKVSNAAQRQVLVNEIESALQLGVSEQDLLRLAGLAVTRGYTAGDVDQFVQKITMLQRNKLPPGLVLDKTLEGMAKRVPAATILQVVSLWSSALEDSRVLLHNMEQKGLAYVSPSERTILINEGATLQQVYGARQVLPALGKFAEESGRIKRSAASIIAAAQLTETLLLYGTSPDQALSLSGSSLRADYSSQRIQSLQRSVLDQLRQGVAVTDIIAAQQRQFGMPQNLPRPAFGTAGQSFGSSPNGPLTGGLGSGNTPNGFSPGMPGSGMPGSAGRPNNFSTGAPGSGFPGTAGRSMPGGNFPGR
ncbi:MAG: hypothetical protein ACYCSS_06255 [Sulfuriferula sp.]